MPAKKKTRRDEELEEILAKEKQEKEELRAELEMIKAENALFREGKRDSNAQVMLIIVGNHFVHLSFL